MNDLFLSPKEFLEKSQKSEAYIIDIRTPEEYKKYGVLPWVKYFYNMYESDFQKNILSLDTSKTYLIYCWHGVRSLQVLQFMKSLWFISVFHLDWGIDRWEKEWFEVVKETL